MIEKVSKESKQKITEDWSSQFPELSFYKPLRLYNRIGPVLTGIQLEILRGNIQYRPQFQIISLTETQEKNNIESPVVGMDVSGRNNIGEQIDFRFHEQNYIGVARKMKEQALIPFGGYLEISQIIEAILRYLDLGRRFILSDIPIQQIEEIIRLSILLDRPKETQKYQDKMLKLISSLNQSRLNFFIGDIESWKEKMFGLGKGVLLQWIDENVERYKLQKLNSF